MSEGSIPGGVPSIQEFRPVAADVFDVRAERLSVLATGHALEGYLRFVAALVRGQDAHLRKSPSIEPPDTARLEECRAHGLPAISAAGERDPVWRDGLSGILGRLEPDVLPARAANVVASLRRADAADLERDATKLLTGAYADLDPARIPFIGAALQAHWVKMALTLGEHGMSSGVGHGLCPVCGSPPVASVVRSGGAAQGLRYLVCSLCASEWHTVRVKCSACASTEGISYLFIESEGDAVKAECCDACKTYLKIFYLDKDNRMEPQADDLATLGLDMLVDERDYRRVGPNLLFMPGL